MPGPWEQFQGGQSGQSGPWQQFQPEKPWERIEQTPAEPKPDEGGGFVQTVKSGLASAARGGLAVAESIYRTPETFRRIGSALNNWEIQTRNFLADVGDPYGVLTGFKFGPQEYLRVDDPENFGALDFDDGVMRSIAAGSMQWAERIDEANKALSEMFPTFRRIDEAGVRSNEALADAIKGLKTIAGRGDPEDEGGFGKLADVVTDPEAWSIFMGQAVPSLYLAWKSGGSMPFMSWLEGMETAKDAQDFEKRTGETISDEQFAASVAIVGGVNGMLEKMGLDSVTQGRGSILTRLAAGSQIEGLTEAAQEFTQNVAAKGYDEEARLLDNMLGAYMGGAGAGGGAAVVSGVSQGLPIAPSIRRNNAADAQATAQRTSEGLRQAAENAQPESDLVRPGEPIDEPTEFGEEMPIERYQYMRQPGGASPQMEIRPLTQADFIRYVRPVLPDGYANTLEEYQAKHPEATHLSVTRSSPDRPWRVDTVSDPESIKKFARDRAAQIRPVDSFDSPEAQEWAQFDGKEARRTDPLQIDPAKDSLLVAISKLGGMNRQIAESEGVDPAEFDRRGAGLNRVFTQSGRSPDELAELLAQRGYPVLDIDGNYNAKVLVDRVFDELLGEDVRTPQGQEAALEQEARERDIEARRDERYGRGEEPDYDALGTELDALAYDREYEGAADLDEEGKTLADLAMLAREYAGEDAVEDALMADTDAAAARELWALIQGARDEGTAESTTAGTETAEAAPAATEEAGQEEKDWYQINDPITQDEPLTVQVLRRGKQTYLNRGDGVPIEITNMLEAGFSMERAVAQTFGVDTSGKNVEVIDEPKGQEPQQEKGSVRTQRDRQGQEAEGEGELSPAPVTGAPPEEGERDRGDDKRSTEVTRAQDTGRVPEAAERVVEGTIERAPRSRKELESLRDDLMARLRRSPAEARPGIAEAISAIEAEITNAPIDIDRTPEIVDDDVPLIERTRANIAGEPEERARMIAFRDYLNEWLDDYSAPPIVGDLYRQIDAALEKQSAETLAEIEAALPEDIRSILKEGVDDDVRAELEKFLKGFDLVAQPEVEAPKDRLLEDQKEAETKAENQREDEEAQIAEELTQKEIDDRAHEAAESLKNELAHPTQAQKEANGEGNYKLGAPIPLYGVTWRVETPKGSYRHNLDIAGLESLTASATSAYQGRVATIRDLLKTGDVPRAFKILRNGVKGAFGPSDARGKALREFIDRAWFNKMPAHYARALEIEGADGDKLDAFLGPQASDQSLPVYVIDTNKLGTKEFDEHKVMIGFKSEGDAHRAFINSYGPEIGPKLVAGIVTMEPAEFEAWVKSDQVKKPALEATLAAEGQANEPAKSAESEAQQPEGSQPEGTQETRGVEETRRIPGSDVEGGARGTEQPDESGLFGSGGVGDGQAGLFDAVGTGLDVGRDHRSERGPVSPERDARNREPRRARSSGSVSGSDYVITAADEIGKGGAKTKARQNIEAIRIVKDITAENRAANSEEQAALVKYVGWGGIPQIFDPKNEKWKSEFNELRELLTDEEYAAARRSTQDAHYTSQAVINGIYKGLRRMGFSSGKLLEPAVGVGHFFGLMPESLRGKTQSAGVELDHLTAAIAQALYPKKKVHQMGFQDFNVPDNYYDVVVGNPPFGSQKIFDRERKGISDFSIHNYFIAKAIDVTRPGGVVGVVVSRYFMDATHKAAREYISKRAKLIAAFRLPRTAFMDNANTEVVTDVIFLQKRESEVDTPDDWVNVDRLEVTKVSKAQDQTEDIERAEIDSSEIRVNQYFIAHPEHVLGEFSLTGSMYRKDELTVEPRSKMPPPFDTTENWLDHLAGTLPENIIPDRAAKHEAELEAETTKDVDLTKIENVQIYGHFEQNGKIYQRQPDIAGERQATLIEAGDTKVRRLSGLIKIRDLVRAQLRMEVADDPSMETNRQKLGRSYDAFVKRFGYMSQQGNKNAFYADPSYPLLTALEEDFDRGISAATAKKEGVPARKPSAKKAAIFTRRVLVPHRSVKTVTTASDALVASLAERGRIDPAYIERVYGKPFDETMKALGERVFELHDGSGWVTADEYLSGNVKAKLKAASAAAARDSQFNRNVQALSKVIPADLEPIDISVNLDSPWIPGKDLEAFARHLLGETTSARIVYVPAQGKFSAQITAGDRVLSRERYGTDRIGADDILERFLRGTPIKIYDKLPGDTSVLNIDATQAATEKVEVIKRAFQDWIWEDEERRTRLARYYNDTFNTDVEREYDGSHLGVSADGHNQPLPGANPEIELRPHQKNFVWRFVQSGRVLADHVVGAGKAQPLDAKVLTPDGWRLMGGMKIGDLVIAGDGSPTRITGVFPQGEKDIFRVEFSDGSSTECCDEHLWLTQTYRERGYSQRASRVGKEWPCGNGNVRSLAEIRKTLKADHLGAKNHSIPIVGAVQFNARSVPIDPYLLGALLGDGSFRGSTPMISSADAELVDAVSKAMPPGMRVVHRSAYDYALVSEERAVANGSRRRNMILDPLRELGLWGKMSHEKHIPQAYIFNSAEVRLAVLQGLMDTDGWVQRHSSCFSTTSEYLADDVTTLVESLGGIVRRRESRPNYTHNCVRKIGRLAITLTIRLPSGLVPFRLARKENAYRPATRYQPTRYIVSVTPVGKKAAQCIRVAHESHLYVTDRFIVTHNTFAAISAVMERKRVGLINKPMFAVPNHLVDQWKSDFYLLYPGAKLLTVTKKDFARANRRAFTARIATGDWDAVIIAHSSFGFIPMPVEALERFVNEQALEVDQSKALLDDSTDRRSIKEMEKSIERLKEKLKAKVEAGNKDDVLAFEELGVDALVIDEAHMFKNLMYQTSLGRQVAGLGTTTGSNRAMDLFVKMRWLLERNENQNVMFLTGTPISNTIAEMYTMQRYLGMDDLRARGLSHFDAWAKMFAEQVADWEIKASGVGYELKTRFRAFQNFPELIKMYREFADVVTKRDLKQMRADAGLPSLTPPIKGDGPQNIVVDRSPSQALYMALIVNRAENLKNVDPDEDNMLKITGDARKMALDMRLIDPEEGDYEGSKVWDAARRAKAKYDEFNHVKGTQLFFIDLSTPKGRQSAEQARIAEVVRKAEEGDDAALEALSNLTPDQIDAANAKFDVYNDLKNKLVQLGIPEREIEFIHSANTELQKEALFERVRQGETRFLFGSTEKMGAGMNVQRRLVALHHLDAPWRPSDLEQREGRIDRQGNWLYQGSPDGMFKPIDSFEIEINRYATEQTYDSRMWQTIENKARVIEQARYADPTVRKLEDIGGEAANAAAMKAAASGNPLIEEEIKLRSDIKKLENLEREHTRKQHRLQGLINKYSNIDGDLTETLALVDADLATRTAKPPKGEFAGVKVRNASFSERKKGGQAIAIELVQFMKSGRDSTGVIGTYRGFDFAFVRDFSGYGIVMDGKAENYSTYFAKDDKIDPVGIFVRLDNKLDDIEETRAWHQNQAERHRGELANAKQEIGQPFEQKADLEAKVARHREVLTILAEEAKKDQEQAQNGSGSADNSLSFGAAKNRYRGIGVEATKTVADRVTKGWTNMPARIIVTTRRNMAGVPESSKEFLSLNDKRKMANGLYNKATNSVFLFGDNLSSEAEVERVILHEILGHFASMSYWGPNYRMVADFMLNSFPDIAQEVAKDYRLDMRTKRGRAVGGNEVIARLAERIEANTANAKMLRAWDRFVKWLNQLLKRIGFTINVTRAEARDLIRTQAAYVRKGKGAPVKPAKVKPTNVRDYVTDPANEAELSMSLSAETSKRKRLLLKLLNSTEAMTRLTGEKGQPIDRIFRAPFNVIGSIDERGVWHMDPRAKVAAKNALDEAKRILASDKFSFLHQYVQRAHNALNERYQVDELARNKIESVKRGLIDRYGQTEEFKRRSLRVEADRRALLLQGEDILKRLVEAGVESKEAAIIYRMMTMQEVGSEEFQELAAPIRQAIDVIGQEYVALGMVSAESYEYWRETYLPRSYLVHESNANGLTKFANQILTARRKRIIGNQFKGRGITIQKSQARILEKVPEDWWGRKNRPKAADETLIGTKFHVLEVRRQVGEGTINVPGMDQKKIKERVVGRVYWPEDLPIPKAYRGFETRGVFEVTDVKGGDIVLWRDYTKEERAEMGEIIDARYAIAKAFMQASNDLSTGRFFRDIAANPEWASKGDPEGDSPNASERLLESYSAHQWVKVPETKVPETGVHRYGALAGMYVRAEIWADLVMTMRMQKPGIWRRLLTTWKINKTARNPVVHMNNIMSNFVLMDLIDVRMRDFVRGITSYVEEDDHYRDALEHGAFGADIVTQELKQSLLGPVIQEMEREASPPAEGLLGIMGRVATAIHRADQTMIDAYRMEDELFRMATYLRETEHGAIPEEAARHARTQFLDYDIRAPWVVAARETVLPFIAYTYRAVPVVSKSLADRPWKWIKLFTLGFLFNLLAYAVMDDDDEDEERATLRPEERGLTWVGIPRMLRFPGNDRFGNPIFWDVRRFVPAGDIFDMNQGSSAFPIFAPLQFGGPLMIGTELMLNKAGFTGEEITNPLTDTTAEKFLGVGDYLYKSVLPSAPWIPGSWYYEKIKGAATGELDSMMREYSVPLAISSSLGMKLKPHDVQLNRQYLLQEMETIDRALSTQMSMLARDLSRNRISQSYYEDEVAEIQRKREKLNERRQELAPR